LNYLFSFLLVILSLQAHGQALNGSRAQADSTYARKNAFGFFTAYSPDSSHILLGDAENRRLLEFGAVYNRKLLLNRLVHWQYSGEILPVSIESDPLVTVTLNLTTPAVQNSSYPATAPITACVSGTQPYTFTDPFSGTIYSGTMTESCSRQWTIGEAFSPVGFQWNFQPRHKLQPFLIGHGGYMYSTHAIPTAQAGAFNFTFDFGAGFELFRTHSRSLRAEYRYHHISNHNTAQLNPGIDNGLIQLTYVFGR
jgi:hypothetical protein